MRGQAERDQFELLSSTKPSMLSRINKLKIAPRLFLCFALIVLLMLVGNSLLVWQFNLGRQQSNRVSALARELAVVSRFQTDVLSFDARLDSLAKSEDIDGLKQEVGHLRSVLFTDTEAVRDALIHLPSDVPRDTAILPTVQAIEITLPPQLDAVIALGAASDWNAARLRLANEKKPLEASASNLVRHVEQQVTDQLSQSVAQAQRVQSRILQILPLTALVTLLVAVLLGLAITQSISAPLRKLLQGSTALARGDFDHQVQLSGNDELAHLGTVFNETTAKLRALYRQIQSSEAHLAEAQRVAHMGSWVWRVAGRGALHLSEEWYRIYGFDPKLGMPEWNERLQRVHPEDRGTWQGTIERAIQERSDYEVEFRILLPDGTIKWVQTVGHPVLSTAGELVQFIGISMDVTERKTAEERIRGQEAELRQMLDLVPQLVAVFGRDHERIYANRMGLDYLGVSLEEWRQTRDMRVFVHPDDGDRMRAFFSRAIAVGSSYELEYRVRKHDGGYRWFLARYNPVHDEVGRVARWYVAFTDIEDRKRAEERLREENAALREEIDKASMFEEIVGTSPALKAVLSHISKVAASDSTVLITGETGTGKELVARAIHRRSDRVSRPFVSVNCAAIPRDLIASELFGHEKGAFTGATQRRLGKFELANGGTLFLDEVGELPTETQIALLRVLQEREFERVGGSRQIRADVRVIAATNRDLQAAVHAGSFRSDLFYRLNVFPIENPPLRDRRADIPLLVEYFIDRFARKAGKTIRHLEKSTLELLQSYAWPGNIRELQNVIERSVILCETEIFSIDESWLPKQPSLAEPKSQMELPERLLAQEKEMIEAALKESRGRIFGPTGAAAKLGIPRSTLESKIRSLKINKNHFRISPET
jgi:PAS domain S-box-containing protein